MTAAAAVPAALATINSRAMPKTCQRWPLVSALLRPRLANGPVCSTTAAGTATANMAARMMPGTSSRMQPKPIANPMQISVPSTGKNRRNAMEIESPTLTGRPSMSWNAAW